MRFLIVLLAFDLIAIPESSENQSLSLMFCEFRYENSRIQLRLIDPSWSLQMNEGFKATLLLLNQRNPDDFVEVVNNDVFEYHPGIDLVFDVPAALKKAVNDRDAYFELKVVRLVASLSAFHVVDFRFPVEYQPAISLCFMNILTNNSIIGNFFKNGTKYDSGYYELNVHELAENASLFSKEVVSTQFPFELRKFFGVSKTPVSTASLFRLLDRLNFNLSKLNVKQSFPVNIDGGRFSDFQMFSKPKSFEPVTDINIKGTDFTNYIEIAPVNIGDTSLKVTINDNFDQIPVGDFLLNLTLQYYLNTVQCTFIFNKLLKKSAKQYLTHLTLGVYDLQLLYRYNSITPEEVNENSTCQFENLTYVIRMGNISGYLAYVFTTNSDVPIFQSNEFRFENLTRPTYQMKLTNAEAQFHLNYENQTTLGYWKVSIQTSKASYLLMVKELQSTIKLDNNNKFIHSENETFNSFRVFLTSLRSESVQVTASNMDLGQYILFELDNRIVADFSKVYQQLGFLHETTFPYCDMQSLDEFLNVQCYDTMNQHLQVANYTVYVQFQVIILNQYYSILLQTTKSGANLSNFNISKSMATKNQELFFQTLSIGAAGNLTKSLLYTVQQSGENFTLPQNYVYFTDIRFLKVKQLRQGASFKLQNDGFSFRTRFDKAYVEDMCADASKYEFVLTSDTSVTFNRTVSHYNGEFFMKEASWYNENLTDFYYYDTFATIYYTSLRVSGKNQNGKSVCDFGAIYDNTPRFERQQQSYFQSAEFQFQESEIAVIVRNVPAFVNSGMSQGVLVYFYLEDAAQDTLAQLILYASFSGRGFRPIAISEGSQSYARQRGVELTDKAQKFALVNELLRSEAANLQLQYFLGEQSATYNVSDLRGLGRSKAARVVYSAQKIEVTLSFQSEADVRLANFYGDEVIVENGVVSAKTAFANGSLVGEPGLLRFIDGALRGLNVTVGGVWIVIDNSGTDYPAFNESEVQAATSSVAWVGWLVAIVILAAAGFAGYKIYCCHKSISLK